MKRRSHAEKVNTANEKEETDKEEVNPLKKKYSPRTELGRLLGKESPQSEMQEPPRMEKVTSPIGRTPSRRSEPLRRKKWGRRRED